jgi:hypothetical protein
VHVWEGSVGMVVWVVVWIWEGYWGALHFLWKYGLPVWSVSVLPWLVLWGIVKWSMWWDLLHLSGTPLCVLLTLFQGMQVNRNIRLLWVLLG